MPDVEHLAQLQKGVDAWNAWRRENPYTLPDLIEANLYEANLEGANLEGANLEGANLFRAYLSGAKLGEAKLIKADLREAHLHGTDLRNAELYEAKLGEAKLIRADLREADLRQAELYRASLIKAKFIGAKLIRADLSEAYLSRANFERADLSEANLYRVSLVGANLDKANLRGASLFAANLAGASLSGADLSGATLGETVLGTNIAVATGLEECLHQGPSLLDFQSLLNARAPVPVAFLRGMGWPDPLIKLLPSLRDEAEFHSCFISYSSKDQEFADRLHADLKKKGVHCWRDKHDLRIGEKFHDAINSAIQRLDKVLLILSENAIASGWVEREVTRALSEELTRKQVVLFPVRLDDAVLQTSEAWAQLLKDQRHIGDFTRWKDRIGYRKSLERVLRDLKVAQGSAE